ncbi:cytochrome P450 [Skermania piniformis]|uniref:Cytochrome P450 n=1 Tax=Skermania pinensis TaxID=39122 RepID=A0ABX8S3K4_9ACTN|nr:cytochrome P450 [Skermania piniformis]QXQ12400.1 cytochrome P450 [Skermania piniformis]
MHELDDPYPHYAMLRTQAPVSRVADSSFHLVSSWELVTEAVKRADDFSSNLTATMVWQADGSVTEFPLFELGSPMHVLATADEPTHRRHRRMVLPALSATRIRALQPFIADALATMWAAGRDGDRIDWVTAVAQRLPMAVVAELVGFPTCDIDELIRWSFAATALLDGMVEAAQLAEAAQAAGELADYLNTAFSAELADPGATAMGDLARQVRSGEVQHDTAVFTLIQLVIAGAESTVSLVGSAVWLLGRHPDITAQLRADRDLVAPFIEEVLRLESPFRGHYRHVTTDTQLGGVPLAAGDRLYLLWGAANRDPAVFDEPDEIHLAPARRQPHLAFGQGLHRCVGAALARIEGNAAVGFLLDATTDFEVTVDEPDWQPSLLVRRLRSLELTAR